MGIFEGSERALRIRPLAKAKRSRWTLLQCLCLAVRVWRSSRRLDRSESAVQQVVSLALSCSLLSYFEAAAESRVQRMKESLITPTRRPEERRRRMITRLSYQGASGKTSATRFEKETPMKKRDTRRKRGWRRPRCELADCKRKREQG